MAQYTFELNEEEISRLPNKLNIYLCFETISVNHYRSFLFLEKNKDYNN